MDKEDISKILDLLEAIEMCDIELVEYTHEIKEILNKYE